MMPATNDASGGNLFAMESMSPHGRAWYTWPKIFRSKDPGTPHVLQDGHPVASRSRGAARTRAEYHFRRPSQQYRSVGAPARRAGERVVGVVDDPVGYRVGLAECVAVADDHRRRNQMVVARFDDQHVAGEIAAGTQRTVVVRFDQAAAVLVQRLARQRALGSVPVLVLV